MAQELLYSLQMTKQQFQSCIDACNKCITACTACETACLAEKTTDMTHMIALDRDCADICALAVKLMSRESEFSKQACALCAIICDACAKSCDMHAKKFEHCRLCAEACRSCAAECRKMAA